MLKLLAALLLSQTPPAPPPPPVAAAAVAEAPPPYFRSKGIGILADNGKEKDGAHLFSLSCKAAACELTTVNVNRCTSREGGKAQWPVAWVVSTAAGTLVVDTLTSTRAVVSSRDGKEALQLEFIIDAENRAPRSMTATIKNGDDPPVRFRSVEGPLPAACPFEVE